MLALRNLIDVCKTYTKITVFNIIEMFGYMPGSCYTYAIRLFIYHSIFNVSHNGKIGVKVTTKWLTYYQKLQVVPFEFPFIRKSSHEYASVKQSSSLAT